MKNIESMLVAAAMMAGCEDYDQVTCSVSGKGVTYTDEQGEPSETGNVVAHYAKCKEGEEGRTWTCEEDAEKDEPAIQSVIGIGDDNNAVTRFSVTPDANGNFAIIMPYTGDALLMGNYLAASTQDPTYGTDFACQAFLGIDTEPEEKLSMERAFPLPIVEEYADLTHFFADNGLFTFSEERDDTGAVVGRSVDATIFDARNATGDVIAYDCQAGVAAEKTDVTVN